MNEIEFEEELGVWCPICGVETDEDNRICPDCQISHADIIAAVPA